MVNNAAYATLTSVVETSEEDWDGVLAVNLNAAFLFCKYAAQSMIKRGKGGKIINVTSLASAFGSGVFPSYAVTKGGLAQLTRSLAIELGPHNIQVNALAPGWVSTEMTEWLRTGPEYEWLLKEMIQRTPRGRFAEAEELKGAVVFLASSASDNMTGADLLIDGEFDSLTGARAASARTDQGDAVMAAPQMFNLDGRVAVVTGGNGGIGRGIALGLAEAGATVAVLARNEEKNEAVLGELRTLGSASMALQLDVTDRNALAPAMAEVERKLGPVDILVNNAGIALPGGVLKVDAATWDRVIETNLNSGFLLSQIAARSMAQRKRGKIINIASEYSHFGNPIAPSYAASKGGLVQLTKSMAVELAAHNIQVNAIVPGWIESEMTAPIKGRPFYDDIIKRTPAGRFGTPRGMRGRGSISSLARLRLRNRRDHLCRRRLRDSLNHDDDLSRRSDRFDAAARMA